MYINMCIISCKKNEIFSIFFGQKLKTEYYKCASDLRVFYTHFWISFLSLKYLPSAARAVLQVQFLQGDFVWMRKTSADYFDFRYLAPVAQLVRASGS